MPPGYKLSTFSWTHPLTLKVKFGKFLHILNHCKQNPRNIILEGRWKPHIQLSLPAKMGGKCNIRWGINRPCISEIPFSLILKMLSAKEPKLGQHKDSLMGWLGHLANTSSLLWPHYCHSKFALPLRRISSGPQLSLDPRRQSSPPCPCGHIHGKWWLVYLMEHFWSFTIWCILFFTQAAMKVDQK